MYCSVDKNSLCFPLNSYYRYQGVVWAKLVCVYEERTPQSRISWVYVQYYVYHVNWIMRTCYYVPCRLQKTGVFKLHRITSQRV